MDATLKINAECGTLTADNTLDCMSLESVWVSMAGEARTNGDEVGGAEWRCVNCHDPLRDPEDDGYGPVYVSAENGLETCRDAVSTDNRHVAERIPLSWANSVGIEFDEKHDLVRFSISIADPRGARIRRALGRDTGTPLG